MRAAAASGRRVIAADVFCDVDTQQVAVKTLKLGYRDGGFDPEDICQQLLPLLPETSGVLYGSGFETQPELLATLGQYGRVFGNSAQAVRAVKDPFRFFTFLASRGIRHPEWTMNPVEGEGWISKQIGGSGGTHIAHAMGVTGGRYYQRLIQGRSITLLFVADGKHIRAVGFNEQLTSAAIGMPYRFGGAVSQVSLPRQVQDWMLGVAESITAEFALQGLGSLDCIVDNEQCWVLEVNPRLSATFALYDAAHDGALLLESHLQACEGCLPEPLPSEPSQAHLIYYAPFDLAVPAAMTWPTWVADRPESGSRCGQAEPLCTIKATAIDASAALALAHARVKVLTTLLINFELKMELS